MTLSGGNVGPRQAPSPLGTLLTMLPYSRCNLVSFVHHTTNTNSTEGRETTHNSNPPKTKTTFGYINLPGRVDNVQGRKKVAQPTKP